MKHGTTSCKQIACEKQVDAPTNIIIEYGYFLLK